MGAVWRSRFPSRGDKITCLVVLILVVSLPLLCVYAYNFLPREPLLDHLRYDVDSGWTQRQISTSPFHLYSLELEKDKKKSCRIRPTPSLQQVDWGSGFQVDGWISRCQNRTAFFHSTLKNQVKLPMANLQGTYEIQAGYYRSAIRTFNVSLVGLEQEVAVEYDLEWEGVWRIRKVGVSYKFQDLIFQYSDEELMGSKLPQLEGQCWHFNATDLKQKKTLPNTQLKTLDILDVNFASLLEEFLPYRLFGVHHRCIG